ncbi:putative Polyadenylate-binding protein [Blattamonas nauphoetae]|uniref:Polyadenylate-binding protein n=1 Tax=Blattamonas nauphoetae TaxID=2049346 RepID=A0ABQ9YK99_9EUKA|nr:putative Polyadenylate-binding protein [Blattamonas nauphoetae]
MEPVQTSSESSFEDIEYDPERNLIVRQLPQDAREEDFQKLFKAIGETHNCRVIYDRNSGLCRGFGFVTYFDKECAKRAVENLNGHQFGTRRISVEYRKDPPKDQAANLRVIGIPSTASLADVHSLFSQYGTVTTESIQHSPDGSSPSAYIVSMVSKRDAEKAMGALNGSQPFGQTLSITLEPIPNQQNQRNRQGMGQQRAIIRQPSMNPAERNTLFVHGLQPDTTEQFMTDLFSTFGQVIDVLVMRDKITSRCKGYGFVTFDDRAQAQVAVDELNGKELNGKRLQVSFKSAKPERSAPTFQRGQGVMKVPPQMLGPNSQFQQPLIHQQPAWRQNDPSLQYSQPIYAQPPPQPQYANQQAPYAQPQPMQSYQPIMQGPPQNYQFQPQQQPQQGMFFDGYAGQGNMGY